MEGRGRQAADDRPDGPFPPAQGDGGQGRGRVHLAEHRAGGDSRWNARRAFRQGDHRRRLRAGRARLHPRRSAHLGFDRGARTALHPQAHAGAWRRHHRARDGDGLSRARRGDHRHRNDGPADAGRRSRYRRAPGQAARQALRHDPLENQGDRGQGGAGGAGRHLRGARAARRPSRSTPSLFRSAAARTAN